MREYFWLPPDCYTRSPLTDEAVRDAETRLKKKLPAAYLELLYVQNGGSTRYNIYPTSKPTTWAEDHVPFDGVLGIGSRPGIFSVSDTGLSPDLVPLSWEEGCCICLDYRACGPDGEPSMLYLDYEMGKELQLAASMSEFLDGLVYGLTRYVFGFASVRDGWEELLRQVSSGLSISLGESLRVQGFMGTHPAWPDWTGTRKADFRLYRNRGEQDYEGFPWRPECDWLLMCDIKDSLAGEVLMALRQSCSIPVLKLHVPPWKW